MKSNIFPPHHSVRIIPRLDIKGPNLVKGIHLEGLRVLGDPAAFARYYVDAGADELMYQDVVASLYGRNSLLEFVEKTASEISIPLTVGGGIRSTKDIYSLLRVGADKVSINTAAISNPKFITEATREFGSSTIVASIEAIREKDGSYLCYTNNGREHTGVRLDDWVSQLEDLGVGEIVITSVDKEGLGAGYDLDLIKAVSSRVSIPVVAHGGAGCGGDLVDALRAGADALCIASVLHYGAIEHLRPVVNSTRTEGNIEFLTRKSKFGIFETSTIKQFKQKLEIMGVKCRNNI